MKDAREARWIRAFVFAVTAVGLVADAGADTYTSAVLSDGPVGYWTLDESGGSTAVNVGSTGTAIDGTYTAGTTQQVMMLVPTSSTLATDFDGTTGRITVPNDGTINTVGPFEDKSVELWFQAATLPTAGSRVVLWEQGGNDRGINVYIDGSDLYVNTWNTAADAGNAPWGPLSTSTTIEAGKTYHVVLSHDGNLTDFTGDVTGYVNGTSIGTVGGVGRLNAHGSGVGIGAINGATKYADGSTQASGAFFDGLIGHVAHYDGVALSSTQVAAHFAASGREDLEYNYQANDPVNATSGSWASDVDQASADRTWTMTGTSLGSTSSAFTGITASYTYDTTDTAHTAEFDLGEAGTTSTFEAWFKPTDLTGQEVVFTTGGATRGANISLDGSTLRFKIREDAGGIVDVLATVELNNHEIDEFIQVVGVVDQGNELQLYVNGSKRDTATITGTVDWTGTNDAGLGSRGANGGLGGETSTEVTGYGTLNGEIATFRVYKDTALTDEQIMDNFLGGSGFSGVESAENIAFVVNPTDATESGNANANESDEFIQMWQENKSVTLSSALDVDHVVSGAFSITGGPYDNDGTIASGTKVQSFYFHLDNTEAGVISPTITITFVNEILGLIWDNDNLDASNGPLGVTGVTYEASNGMEITGGTGGNDAITISADRKTLTLTMQVGNSFVDDLRVVVAVPTPAALPAGLAMLLLVGGRRRRR